MKSYILEYKIKPGFADKARELIMQLISAIQNEEGTLLYAPFYFKIENHKFMHVITFENEKSEADHFENKVVKDCMQSIAQISITEPKLTEIEYIQNDSN